MSRLLLPAPVIAIFYGEGSNVDSVMQRIAHHLKSKGASLAGFIQRAAERPDRSRCDMILEELASGEVIGISLDRGSGARGCRLDIGELMRALVIARKVLDTDPDLFIINKFGKTECEGGGFRPLIAEAVEREVPILIAVPLRNADGWRNFIGDFAINHRLEDLPRDAASLCRCLGLAEGSGDPFRIKFGEMDNVTEHFQAK